MTLNYTLFPLTHQSQDLPFVDWVTLFTVCLAPLIAHVTAGAPRPSYLTRSRPKWHDRMCLYNPTSILWRYAAITDRRIRALAWDSSTMAASNALFWTSRGWDGTEEMVAASRPLSTRRPDHSRVEWVSSEMVMSVIITLQGLQAVWTIVGGLTGAAYFNSSMGLDGIFFPLSIFGLLRLCAAFWVTDDFYFTTRDDVELEPLAPLDRTPHTSGPAEAKEDSAYGYYRIDSLLAASDSGHAVSSQFRPTSYWPSRVFRVLYMVPFLAVWVLAAFYTLPFRGRYSSTITSWLVGVFYLLLITASTGIYTYYFARGRTTTTLIPCISAAWYKVYTALVYGMMLALIVVAAVETRKTPCGKYTSLGGVLGDVNACTMDGGFLYPVNSVDTGPFALATRNPIHPDDTAEDGGNTWLYNFTGSCFGRPDDRAWSDRDYVSLYNGSGWESVFTVSDTWGQ